LAFWVIIAGLVGFSLFWLARSFPQPRRAPPLEFLLLLSCWAYAGLLAVSINWIDATTPLDNRILMPVYLNIILLLGIGLAGLWQRRAWLPRLVAAAGVFWLGYYLFTRLDGTVQSLTSDGQGYASLRWKHSPTLQFIREQDPSLVYTNDVTAVYFLADLDSVGIPNYQSNEAEFAAMRQNLRASSGFLVLFGSLTGEFASLDELTNGMTLIALFDDGMVYKFPP
jgi:hypothetical protein